MLNVSINCGFLNAIWGALFLGNLLTFKMYMHSCKTGEIKTCKTCKVVVTYPIKHVLL